MATGLWRLRIRRRTRIPPFVSAGLSSRHVFVELAYPIRTRKLHRTCLLPPVAPRMPASVRDAGGIGNRLAKAPYCTDFNILGAPYRSGGVRLAGPLAVASSHDGRASKGQPGQIRAYLVADMRRGLGEFKQSP